MYIWILQDFLLDNHCSHFQIRSSGIKKDWSAGVIRILRWIQQILIIRWIWQNCGIFHVHCPQSPRTERVTLLRKVRNYDFSFFAFLPLWHWSWSEILDFRVILMVFQLKIKIKSKEIMYNLLTSQHQIWKCLMGLQAW